MTDIDWLDPWYPTGQPGLVKQLRAEMGPGHVLESEPDLRLIARRDDTDDALFALADGRVAEVHLTWRQTREQSPAWPATAVFASLEDWATRSMVPLRNELDRLFPPA